MRSNLKLLMFSIVGLVLLVQFTNCSEFDQGTLSMSSHCGEDGLCEGAQLAALSIRLAPRTTLSKVSESSNKVLASGDCTTGNFPSHTIKVTYRKNSEIQVNDEPYKNACLNGKFYLQITVRGSSLRSQDQVHVSVQIYGLDNGVEVESLGLASSRSYIFP